MKYMVDTCAFNRIADRRLLLDELPSDIELVATYVQVTEINKTKDEQRRLDLFLTFAHLEHAMEHTASFIFGKTPLGLAPFGIGEEFDAIKSELDGRNNSKANNTDDALIAESALKNGYGLLTADRDLAEVFAARSAYIIYIEA